MSTILVHTLLLRGLPVPEEANGWTVVPWDHTQGDWRADLLAREQALPEGHVLVHCSLMVARWLRAHAAQVPRLAAGLVLPEAQLRAHALNGTFGEKALNRQALYAPFGTLLALEDSLDRALGGARFLRPDSPMKPFAGRPIPGGGWAREIAAIAALDAPDPGTLCMIAPLQRVAQPEWRFWCVDATPVAWAPYSFTNHTGPSHPPEDLVEIARQGAQDLIGADPFMVVDCTHDGEGKARIVEANGFSTSGFYPGVDLPALWRAATGLFMPW